jgi:membrane protein
MLYLMTKLLEKLRQIYLDNVWGVDAQTLSPVHRAAVRILRLLHNLALELAEGHLTLRAMSLVYTTLLSLVPLLAVSFSLFKAFGVHNQLEPLLRHFLEPLGDKGVEFSHRIMGFVENVQVGVLGSLGLVLLLYTVVSLVQKIEEAFNYIWRIRRPRRLVRRFSDYMSVVLIGPVLVFAALGITAAVMGASVIRDLVSIGFVAVLVGLAGRLLPYILICAAFTFVYIFLPNTKVKFSAALVGGLVAGILWESGGWGFAAFISSSTRYTAIYSGFAIVIMFMIWLYVSWLILLLGAQVAYYFQYPALLNSRRREWSLSNEDREKAAILAALLIGYNYYHQLAWWSLESLAQRMNIPSLSLQPILDVLEKNSFISESGEEPSTYFPARDIETIKLASIIEAIRHDKSSLLSATRQDPESNQLGKIMQRVDSAIDSALDQQTIKDLVLTSSVFKED